MPYLPLLALLLLTASCYEDRLGCLDPNAVNYDLRADEACPDDCCEFPEVRLVVTRLWNEESLVLTDTLTDGAGNPFRLLRLRFYLGDIELVADDDFLPTPQAPTEVQLAEGVDTITVEINANAALVGTTGGAVSVGSYRLSGSAVTGLRGTYGLAERFAPIIPNSAPASSPLSVKPGLLNFSDGRGYVRASAEYILTATNDTLRADAFGSEELALDLPLPALPSRGQNLDLNLVIDYAAAFEGVDLLTAPERFAERLPAGFTLSWE